MKVLFLECSAEEIRANRRLMDNMIDAFSALADAMAGSTAYTSEDDDKQVVQMLCKKEYGEIPHLDIKLYAINKAISQNSGGEC